MEEDDEVVGWYELRKEYGIKYCRTHVYRLMRKGKFPRAFSLTDTPRSRIGWWRREIRDHLKIRANSRK